MALVLAISAARSRSMGSWAFAAKVAPRKTRIARVMGGYSTPRCQPNFAGSSQRIGFPNQLEAAVPGPAPLAANTNAYGASPNSRTLAASGDPGDNGDARITGVPSNHASSAPKSGSFCVFGAGKS